MQTLELTANAGTAVGTAVKGIGSALDTVRSWVKSKGNEVPEDVRDMVLELTSRVADAKLANTELTAKLADLQQQIVKEDTFAKEKARYELIGTPTGSFIWGLRAIKTQSQPMH